MVTTRILTDTVVQYRPGFTHHGNQAIQIPLRLLDVFHTILHLVAPQVLDDVRHTDSFDTSLIYGCLLYTSPSPRD